MALGEYHGTAPTAMAPLAVGCPKIVLELVANSATVAAVPE